MKREDRDRQSAGAGKTAVVVGAGNIGSPLIGLLARTPAVGRVRVIDRDVYEPKNLRSQDIVAGDVGRAKAVVQARRLRRTNPALAADAVVGDVATVPLGALDGDVILACLDSKEARRVVNQAAWRLGVPWIDAGVNAAAGLLARVTVYVPAPEAPCLECAWSEEDYATLEQAQPCLGEAIEAAPTNAPASLGALAASLQAIECQKLLSDEDGSAAVCRTVLVDAASHRQFVTALRRNPNCRFDHRTWGIESVARRPGEMTFGQALNLIAGAASGGTPGATSLRVEGLPFVRTLLCGGCGRRRRTLRLAGRLRRRDRRCPGCGGRLDPVGFDMADELRGDADDRLLRRSLASAGLRSGDVFTVIAAGGEARHYRIDGQRRR